MYSKFAMLVLTAIMMSSCSVYMAAKKEGASLSDVQAARTRGGIIALGAEVISSEKNEQGNLVETYKVKKARGSAGRALMHGLLDVSTLGLWEAVGTPVEAVINEDGYFGLRVEYDANDNVVRTELI